MTGAAIDHARTQWGHPVALMGSSIGGLLAIFAVLPGLQPDAAVAHNFVYPGKLISLRLRARLIARFRAPYPLAKLERATPGRMGPRRCEGRVGQAVEREHEQPDNHGHESGGDAHAA